MLATPTVVYTRQLDALSAWEKAKLGLDKAEAVRETHSLDDVDVNAQAIMGSGLHVLL